jgi:thioredoxin 1
MGLLNWLGMESACEKEPVELTDENFRQEVVESEIPVMVDVWSNGCGPCRAMVPTVKKLACKYDGKVKVAQLNVAAGPRSAARYGIQGTPTTLFFEKGREVERVVGFRGQLYFEQTIDEVLLHLPDEGETDAAAAAN